jgi:hypothetical protein
MVTMAAAPPELQEGAEASGDDKKMEDRNAQPDQVADAGQVNQTALQLEEGRIYISDSMALFQHHGSVNLMSGGWVWVLVFSISSPSTRPTLQFKFKVAVMVELGLQLAMILLSVIPRLLHRLWR